MRILIPVGDLLEELFPEATDYQNEPDKLKARLRHFYSRGPVEPSVRIEGDLVIIDVDTAAIEQFESEYDRAASFARRGKYEQAKEILARLIEKYPTASDLYRIYGQALYEQGQTDKALDHLIDALRWDPENVNALLLLGNYYLSHRDDISTAEKFYDRAASIEPDNHLILNNLGGMMLKANRLEEAERYLRLALKAESEYPNTHYGLAMLCHGTGRYLEAFGHAVSAVKLSDKRDPIQQPATNLVFQIVDDYERRQDAFEIAKPYLESIEEACGKGIEIKAADDIDTPAKLEVAEYRNRDTHVVKYKPDATHHAHLVMHELVHLDFITQARIQANNKLFITDNLQKQKFIQDADKTIRQLRKRNLPRDAVDGFISSLFKGMTNQMYNAPIDLFIEKHLYESFPKLRPIQFASLFRMISSYAKSATDRDMRKLAPRHIYEANVVLNLTHAFQLRDLYGVDLSSDFRAPRSLQRLAESLYGEYEEIKNDRRGGEEYELIEDWAKDLKVDTYFEIRDETTTNILHNIEADPLNLETPERDQSRLSLESSPVGSMAVTMYLVDTLNMFSERDRQFVQDISFEVAMLGNYGLDPGDPEKKYSLKTVPGRKFSALHLLAIMYVGFNTLDPSLDTGLDFHEEYEAAKVLVKKNER